MVIIDTSALVRFFTNDDAKKSELTAKLLESGEPIVVPEAVLVEMEYVLTKLYDATKQECIKAYRFLLSNQAIQTDPYAPDALAIYAVHPVSFADCLIAAQSKNEKLASFDQKLLKIPGVKSYWG